MKCLMRMHAQDNMGVLFFETCISFKQQRHTYIEAVPMPFEQFQDAPAYFRVRQGCPSLISSRSLVSLPSPSGLLGRDTFASTIAVGTPS